jgi:hypothetical protein
MENVIFIIIGVLSSLTALFVFLLCLSRLRPKILISSQIEKGKTSQGGNCLQNKSY